MVPADTGGAETCAEVIASVAAPRLEEHALVLFDRALGAILCSPSFYIGKPDVFLLARKLSGSNVQQFIASVVAVCALIDKCPSIAVNALACPLTRTVASFFVESLTFVAHPLLFASRDSCVGDFLVRSFSTQRACPIFSGIIVNGKHKSSGTDTLHFAVLFTMICLILVRAGGASRTFPSYGYAWAIDFFARTAFRLRLAHFVRGAIVGLVCFACAGFATAITRAKAKSFVARCCITCCS